MEQQSTLTGKTAIITGANRGIGRATVELFAKNSVNIWATLRQPSTEFEQWSQTLAMKNKIWIKTVYLDLSNEDSIKNAILSISKDKINLDILINNAGTSHLALLQMTSLKQFHDIFQVNFFAQVYLIQLVSRLMQRQHSGTIINVSSIESFDARPGMSAYGASKAALNHLTKTASRELAIYGIRVNAVAPGLTETDLIEKLYDNEKSAGLFSSSLNRFAKPEEIAEAILFLASDQSSFITGQTIRVDGGL